MVISDDSHVIGGHKLAVWPLEATVYFVGVFNELEAFLLCTAYMRSVQVLCVVTASSCDHGY